ncbi:hypothetical protein LJ739_08845 [Aestuariibacter halophilus]|uniref:Uncharacterized protein n=1 Tax=Fluctibacter halophilus TaxID=226011 RepID=A0ABS8G720_9ALTE|nr:hypothetical protein [Aestuariibacter halophilus]MCC2616345.1 hypothetical protein [Aestuariibacter halophilus]
MALYKGVGDHIIVNLNTGVAKRYDIKDEGFEILAVQKALPAGASADIQTYMSLKSAFEQFESNAINQALYKIDPYTTSGSTSYSNRFSPMNSLGHCGSGFWSSAVLVDYPFESACIQHDNCYSGFSSRYDCDLQFYQNMMLIVDQISDELAPETLFGAVIFRALFQEKADKFYKGVVYFGEGAYCAATQNTQAQECIDPPMTPPSSVLARIEEEHHYDPTYFGSGFAASNCELWQFPNGLGGFYYMFRNCTWSITP